MIRIIKKATISSVIALLIVQAFLIPIVVVYAEPIVDQENNLSEGISDFEKSLEDTNEREPIFNFSNTHLHAIVGEPVSVSIVSDQKVSDVSIIIPDEAKILFDQLQESVSVLEKENKNEWSIRTDKSTNNFVIPIMFEDIGNYQIFVQNQTITIEVENQKNTMNDVKVEPSDNDYSVNQDNKLDREVSVSNSNEFISALNDSNVEIVSVNESFAVENSVTINRSIKIIGNNHQLNFSTNGIVLGNSISESKLEFENIKVSKTGSAPLITSSATNSRNWNISLYNIQSGDGNNSGLINAAASHVAFIGGNNTYNVTGTNTIITSQILSIENGSSFFSDVSGTIFMNGTDNSELSVKDGSLVDWKSSGVAIDMDGNNPSVNITGEKTNVKVSSTTNSDGGVFIGGSGSSNRGATIYVGDHAEFTVHGTRTTALLMRSNDGKFLVEDNATLRIVSDTASSNNAALRFRSVGNYKFQIKNNSSVEIEKNGGNAPAIRMYGNNNEIEVSGGSNFVVYNAGNGTANNTANSGIQYQSGNNQLFHLTDEGSKVEIKADFGPAVTMTGRGEIISEEGSTFIAEGRTSRASAGIFNTAVSNITLDNPQYFDFRNNRVGGGNVYNVSAASQLIAKNTTFSVWRNGSDFNADADRSWNVLDFSMRGSNFSTINSTSFPDEFNASPESIGTNGLTPYARISANNSPAIIDELRVPTNADKKIFGHVSIPEGKNGYRDAWSNEVLVELEILKRNGSLEKHSVKTVGLSENSEGISIYGEENRGGLFQVDLENFLEPGEIVTVKSVFRGDGERGIEGTGEDIRVEPVKVFPIIPPKPARFEDDIIHDPRKNITGLVQVANAEVTLTVNGNPMNDLSIDVDESGQFEIPLNKLNLKKDDEIQVFVRDNEGSAKAFGVINPPETNNDRGNINPKYRLAFHDAEFEAATILTVGDFSSISPLDPLDPKVEIDPENKPELPENQGLLSIDFVSQFNFGKQSISVKDQTYYAQTQRLLDEDGTVIEDEERPNYIQISDRRREEERNGWSLAVTQREQFQGKAEQQLTGAQLRIANQQLVSVNGEEAPSLQLLNPLTLIPGNKRTLLRAEESEGKGTWIYRFGNSETAAQSVSLIVPKGANPEATSYSTTLLWELSAVPGN